MIFLIEVARQASKSPYVAAAVALLRQGYLDESDMQQKRIPVDALQHDVVASF